MIEVKNLSVQTSKGVVLLDHVEFTLTSGVCTGLTGASGSGKTTLLKALMGVSDGDVFINSGQILLDGEDLLKKPEKVRRDLCGTTLGFIPQNPMTAFNLHVPVGTQMSETFRKPGLSFLPQPVVRRDASAGNYGDFNWPFPSVHFCR